MKLAWKVAPFMDRLEILTVCCLDTLRLLVTEFEELSRELERGLGWHYLLDPSWSAHHLRNVRPRATVLDAGAGLGLIQWHLARRGVNVISVDRGRRRLSSDRIRRGFRVRGLRPGDFPLRSVTFRDLLPLSHPMSGLEKPPTIAGTPHRLRAPRERASEPTALRATEPTNLAKIPDAFVNEILSASEIHHDDSEQLARNMSGPLNTPTPRGRSVSSVESASSGDGYHPPSRARVSTKEKPPQVFRLARSTRSCFGDFGRWLAEHRDHPELEEVGPLHPTPEHHAIPRAWWDPAHIIAGLMNTRVGYEMTP